MPLARRIVLRLETGSGKSLYAQRVCAHGSSYWFIALPRGLEAKAEGRVEDCVAEMKRIADEAYGGAGKLSAQARGGGWEPYVPNVRGRNAEKRRREQAKRSA